MNYDLVGDIEAHGIDVSRLRQEFPDGRFVNTYAAKGPVLVTGPRGNVHYVWTDRKDSGYPNKGIAGKLVFRGGNWRREKDSSLPASPLEVYLKEMDEELRPCTHVKGLEGEKAVQADRKLKAVLRESVEPVGDFFTMLPPEAVGNPKLPKTYCDLTSIFTSEISIGELSDILEISSGDDFKESAEKKLNGMAREATQVLTFWEDLLNGRNIPFGWGDDYKLMQVGDFQMYGNVNGVDGAIVMPSGESCLIVSGGQKLSLEGAEFKPIVCIKLETSPEATFEERKNYLEPVLRADNNPYLTTASDGQVFEGRK